MGFKTARLSIASTQKQSSKYGIKDFKIGLDNAVGIFDLKKKPGTTAYIAGYLFNPYP